jgi:ribose transport system substrate-binding protein
MTGTVAQDPFGQGQKAVETALALLNGEDPGYSDEATKTIYFPVEMVTAENVAEFRASRESQGS